MEEKTIDLNTLSQQELESIGFRVMKERDALIARVQNLNQALLEVDTTLDKLIKAQEEPSKSKKPKD